MASLCRGYLKTQMCFFKILHIISSTPTSTEQREEQQEPFPSKGVGIDLNIRFSSLTESESSRTDSASATLQNSIEEDNFLDLLIEAARVVSGKDESDSEEERGLGTESTTQKGNQEKRKERWVVVDIYGDVLEEREPVVRSKRGRNQALPYRQRLGVMVLPEARLQLRYGSDFGNLIKTGETEKHCLIHPCVPPTGSLPGVAPCLCLLHRDGARLASSRSRIAMEALRWRELLRKSLLGDWLRVFVAAWRLGGGGLALEVQ
ncbi:hypothetical protein LR48_Vigan05g001400 [Vigna angularis]|uniref:Uncharacterized protein n=1 Tax=Phaseolus angularis TaxID=3914 RepID=A0A0L9UHN2_PHAAN|nr:hypothetical protein LR48_Vigan05g001400 [Vigna angularis]